MDRLETFTQYRSLLFSIAYRMLGTVMDAEDMVQETFLRWQRVDLTDVQSAKAYLTAVLTRLCIDHLRLARVQRETYIGPWLPEPLMTDTQPNLIDTVSLAESLSTAFLVLLENLTPMERALLLLHDIFDYSYTEIADILDKREDNCRQILRRARQHLHPEQAPDAPLQFTAVTDQQNALTQQFTQAMLQGDIDQLLAVLADDVTIWTDSGGKVSAARRPVHGADKAARFFLGLVRLAGDNITIRFQQINGQLALIAYENHMPITVMVPVVQNNLISAVHIMRNPDKLQGIPPIPTVTETYDT